MGQRKRPPFDAGEREQLLGWYELQRGIVRHKCAGLPDEAAHRSLLPGSPLMTVGGIVSHLRWTEHFWFEITFLGGDESTNPMLAGEDDDFRAGAGRRLADLVAEYDDQCRRSDEIIAAAELTDRARRGGRPSGHASLRWVIIHMIEETARHAGHLDLLRELLDDERSYY